MSRLFLRERLPPLQLVGVSVSLAGVLTILSHGRLEVLAPLKLNVGDLLPILAMAMWSICTIGLRRRPAGLSMLTFLFVLTVIGDLLAWIFPDERLGLFHVAGIALILSGIGITSRLGRRPTLLPAGID